MCSKLSPNFNIEGRVIFKFTMKCIMQFCMGFTFKGIRRYAYNYINKQKTIMSSIQPNGNT